MAEGEPQGLPVESVRDPRHENHEPPDEPRCPPGECIAIPYVALCPNCDHPVNIPRAGAHVPRIGPGGDVIDVRFEAEPWRLRADDDG